MRPDYCPVVKEPCQEPRCMINGCELRQYQNRAHKREWQGLTDEEIGTAICNADYIYLRTCEDIQYVVFLAKVIEAKLKEKNA